MNKAKLKSYAPQARKDFIAAVVARANLLGISEKNGKLEIATSELRGDVTLIAGQAWPAKVHAQRERLIKRMQNIGVGETAEAIAYTWFNRFAALRYMEIHDYLGHSHRVLSSREGGLPEILTHATELAGALPGLNPTQVADMKLAGNKDGELYRLLLVAQCNALSSAMPFLFERIDDETELLLPDNLLRTDSIVAKLVSGVPEEDWAEVEIIGWLYQFYISEKKDQVIGKVVKSEDIPAATQLFTPNWIVQYLVQNSVGRLWLMANPQSTLAKEWPYYIAPAEQTPVVQAQLDSLTQSRIREDGDTLNPESITVLDPACGSGHILVVAYDVLKAIYLERGYQPRAIPRLILEKNLFGLDIDDRAAQMAGFALLMKARADDRRLFTATDDAGNLQPPKLNVLSLQESKGLNVDELATHLAPFKVQRATITTLVDTFEHAKTFGSLIQVPYALKTHLAVLPKVLALVKQSGDMYASAAADDLLPLVRQAQVLEMQFDAVVANPPYMGGRNMNDTIKSFIQRMYSESRADIYAAFIERGLSLTKKSGFEAMVTMETWMFLSSYEQMRQSTLAAATLTSLIHMPYEGKGRTSMGINFGVSAFCALASNAKGYLGEFQCIRYTEIDEEGVPVIFPVRNERHTCVSQDELQQIPGSPIAYWVSPAVRNVFTQSRTMGSVSNPRQGLATGDNDRFVRFWHEVDFSRIGIGFDNGNIAKAARKKWFPHQKGGDFRKWFGNEECVVDWEDDGRVLRNFKDENGKLRSRPQSIDCYFRECLSWSDVTSASNSFRWHDQGFIPNVIAPVVFEDKVDLRIILLASNNSFFNHVIKALNPTLHFHVGYFSKLPYPKKLESCDLGIADELIAIARTDWNSYEKSWNFSTLPWIGTQIREKDIELAWTSWSAWKETQFARSIELETKNNEFFIDAYDLGKEIDAAVARRDITLADADREKDCQSLISYAIGCMMGRYNLDEPGLIYAHAGNIGFEPGRYTTFPADADGIVPITDELWFTDDACIRIREFMRAVWGPDTLEENLAWLAESLGTKATETPDETIRRYLSGSFYKDHLQTYKKRPIYWLFSSGKQGAFQALVYLHRYHEGTLARMRAEYVVPLTGKMQSRIEMLEKDKDAAGSTATRNKIAKQIEALKKKHVELLAYDEKLRHYADMRISIDLDDGVKVNYGKFGDLLAEVKAVTGGANDE